ncbi:MAG TPA: hypothetical protein PLX26_12795 [Candidatus Competibacteraceae bacterium]|nr:hypothetical protein [Candidatus Competibacteraceae bacterium]
MQVGFDRHRFDAPDNGQLKWADLAFDDWREVAAEKKTATVGSELSAVVQAMLSDVVDTIVSVGEQGKATVFCDGCAVVAPSSRRNPYPNKSGL